MHKMFAATQLTARRVYERGALIRSTAVVLNKRGMRVARRWEVPRWRTGGLLATENGNAGPPSRVC